MAVSCCHRLFVPMLPALTCTYEEPACFRRPINAVAPVSIAQASHFVQEEKTSVIFFLIDPGLHGSDTRTRRKPMYCDGSSGQLTSQLSWSQPMLAMLKLCDLLRELLRLLLATGCHAARPLNPHCSCELWDDRLALPLHGYFSRLPKTSA